MKFNELIENEKVGQQKGVRTMRCFYVSGKIADLDLGSEINAENSFMAAIEFVKRYTDLLKFGAHEIKVSEVEEVQNDK